MPAAFDNTLGAVLTSLMVSLTLYGITLVQAYVRQLPVPHIHTPLNASRDIFYHV